MNFNSQKADFISRINSSSKSKVISIKIFRSKNILIIIKKLYEMGIIKGFIIDNDYIKVILKYKKGNCMIRKISIVSKPSRKIYWNINKIKRMKDKSETIIYFISTTQGIKFDWECIFDGKIGGEIILKLEI